MRSDVLAESSAERQLVENYDAFSCPDPVLVASLDTLVQLIVREYTAALTAAYVGRNSNRIAASSEGLIEYLGQWFTDSASLALPIWDYGFGNLYRSIMDSHADHARYCAAIAACLAAAGLPGAWEARFESPLRLRFARRLLPDVLHVKVTVTERATWVAYEGPDRRGEFQLGSQHSVGDELCEVDHCGVRFSLLSSDALDLTGSTDIPKFEGRVVSAIEPPMAQVFHDAIDIISSYAPEYLRWIARVLHQVFLLEPTGERIHSGSVENYLGLIHMSAHPQPLPVAELLVHEATHQYMNVLRKLQPLDDGTDSRTYWSPPVNTDRPISMIIAALHAFGNVQLFYRLCAARGLPNPAACERQERMLLGWLDALVPPTIDNLSMSPTGNALCKPLIKKLGR
jgi:HEXXH motif-containing protein